MPPVPQHLLEPPLPLMVAVLLLLVFARALGELAERWKQPALVGEIIAGIVLGPSLLGWVTATPELRVVSDLGVFLLVILAGMEIDPVELRRSVQGRSVWIALSGFLVPLALGVGVGWLFDLGLRQRVFLGLAVAITAIPVSIRILLDFGILKTDLGQRVISVAVFNDVVALLILGVLLNLPLGRLTPASLAATVSLTVLKAVGFMVVVLAAYRGIEVATRRFPRFHVGLNRVLKNLRGQESLFAVTIVFVLIFAALSEAVGLHFVVGAFFGAMLLSREILGQTNFRQVERTASGITMGFLAPVFFGVIGLRFDIASLGHGGLAAGVFLAAFGGKILGGYAGGRLAGLAPAPAVTLGVALNGRGTMDLVIASIALANNFIGPDLFSLIVVVGITTTVLTPMLLRRFGGQPPAPSASPAKA